MNKRTFWQNRRVRALRRKYHNKYIHYHDEPRWGHAVIILIVAAPTFFWVRCIMLH